MQFTHFDSSTIGYHAAALELPPLGCGNCGCRFHYLAPVIADRSHDTIDIWFSLLIVMSSSPGLAAMKIGHQRIHVFMSIRAKSFKIRVGKQQAYFRVSHVEKQ